MPTVLDQFQHPPTQYLARAPLFFHFFNGTTPTSWGDLAKDFPLFPLVRYPPRGNSAISATPLPPPAHAALARSRRTYAVLPIANCLGGESVTRITVYQPLLRVTLPPPQVPPDSSVNVGS